MVRISEWRGVRLWVVLELRHAVGGGEKEEEDAIMETRVIFRTVRMVVAAAMLLLSPLFTFGQGDKKIEFKFRLVDKNDLDLVAERYAYEFRVRIGKAETTPRYVGAYRAWKNEDEYPDAAEVYEKPWQFFPEVSPILCSAGDEVFIDWYDHVMTSAHFAIQSWDIYYPKVGKVTIKNKNGDSYADYSDKQFFGLRGTGALDAEVRIPWRHVKDVDAAIYTVLNQVGNKDNSSFTLPENLEDGSTVEVTLTMAIKEWKTLKFGQNTGEKTFDGSMRVRMKSPGDEHFMLNYLNGFKGGPKKLRVDSFYRAYPYPNTDHPGAMPLILEGTLMVVEARSWAVDGVCVDNKWDARSVTLKKPGNLAEINAASVGDDGQAHSGGYWLVPLWGEDHVITVRPGPCPGRNVTINCKDSRISLYTEDGVPVPDGSVVESNRRLYGKFSPYKVEDCSKPPVVQWGVTPDRIQSVPIKTTGEFSFVPGGQEGETIGVWIYNEPIMTKLHYDDKIYSVEYYGDVKNDGESVPCGKEVVVKVKDPSKVDGCVGKIKVDVGGDSQFIEKVGGAWQPVQVTVEGEQAEFTFTQENKKYAIHWTGGPGYSINVEAGESAAKLHGISLGGEVPCGSTVKITVTPGNGLKVQGVKAVYDDGISKVAAPVGSNTLEIASLSQGIQEIEVKVGTDPQVTVDESFNGERVAKIKVYNATQRKNIWDEGKYQVTDGVFANGDGLEVSLEPMGGCVDGDKVEVEVLWNDGTTDERGTVKAANTLKIPGAYDKVTVKVLHSEPKQFTVSWSGTNFKVQQDGRDLTLGGAVACGSSIEIVPTLERCEQVQEVKVNGRQPIAPSQDGKYLHEVKDVVNSIEVAFEPKKINVEWAGVTNVRVAVNGATTPMPVKVDCGADLTVVFTPGAGDGLVQKVTIAEEGKGDVTFTPGSHAEYTWKDDEPLAGQTTVKWRPEGNVTIRSVTLPKKYKVTYTNDPDSKYTVEVVDEIGNSVLTDSQLLGGAKLTVKVTVANPAEWKVVKVNGDGNVTSGGNGVYTYTFKLAQDTEVKVELGKQMYKVSYVQSPDVKEMKVRKDSRDGSEIASGSEVEYGSAIYVYVAVEKKQGSAVQGVESVTVKYEGSGGEVHLGVDKNPEDGWYKLEKLEGEIVGIDVIVEKLEPGEVLIVYSKEAQGGEGEQPYGTKGIVTWMDKDGQRIVPGQKKKVKVSDRITWSLAAAPGVEDSKLLAVCLAVNRGYAQRLEETDRVMKYEPLEKLLDLVEGLKDKVMAQEVTELRLETYVTVKLDPKPLLVLTVRKPKLGDELKVIMPGAGGASLDYDKSYRVSGETEVTLKAKATSPVVLKEIYVEGKERLGLTKEMESTYKLPPYDPASTNGNRLTFYAIFSQEDADNCLLTLQANPPEGGAVTVLRKSNKEELPSGQQYQRELDVEVRVQAKEGYYIKSVIQNGSELYGNVQSDTTKVTYSFSIKLPAKELLVQADFSPIPRGGKEGKTNAVESTALRGVEIYPNPTDGAIEVRGASGVARYAVYDVTGREMLGGVHDGGAQLRIDLGMLASGFYIVQLRSADGGMRAEGVLRR